MGKDGYIVISKEVKEQMKEESKLAEEKRKVSVKCTCGRRVYYSEFNKMGWGVCGFCGSKVQKPRDEFKNKLKEMLKEK